MLKHDGRTVGFTASAFDLLHAGHVLMLAEAKNHCDYLIVALQSDPTIDRPEKNRPIQSMTERWLQLEAVKHIDEIIPYDTEDDLLVLLQSIHPDVRILGDDYISKDFTGKQWCIDHGVELIYANREHKYSSTTLRQKIHKAEQSK
jgi:glycerol-3-phosphate cytidylyltransferase